MSWQNGLACRNQSPFRKTVIKSPGSWLQGTKHEDPLQRKQKDTQVLKLTGGALKTKLFQGKIVHEKSFFCEVKLLHVLVILFSSRKKKKNILAEQRLTGDEVETEVDGGMTD